MDKLKEINSYMNKGYKILLLHGIDDNQRCTCGKENCNSPGKHPLTKNGVHDATNNVEVLSELLNNNPLANIAIATGAESSIIAIDIDFRKNTNGFESLKQLEDRLGILPDTITQKTGGGGAQILYKHPSTAIKNKVNIAPGIDIRNDGGYIVVPPSRHVTGNSYLWESGKSPWEISLAKLPLAWIEFFSNPTISNKVSENAKCVGNKRIINEGTRNDTLFRIACAQRSKGKEEIDILRYIRKVNVNRCVPPLDDSELCTIAASAASYETNEAFNNIDLYDYLSTFYDEEPYGVEEFRLVKYKDGHNYEVVAEFVPIPIEQIILNDGHKVELSFKIKGYTLFAEELPTIEVLASDFNSMKWIIEKWGFDAIMPLNSTMMRHLRHAISIAGKKYAKKTTIYTHTGWKKIDGKLVFLHSGGGIGSNGILTRMDGNLERYIFPSTPANITKVVNTCLNFLEVAPYEVTIPLLSIAFLSPLNEFFRRIGLEPSFIMFLLGQTKSKKTTLASLAMSFFGDFTGKTLPSSFKDTSNALEKIGYLLKDVLTVVDDYHPTTNTSEKNKMEAIAQSLARAYGNRMGRTRMNMDTSINSAYAPRGNLIITGELLPDIGQSGLSRCIISELKKNDVDVSVLTAVQNQKQDLTLMMRAYIEWLIPQAETLPEQLKQGFEQYKKYYAPGIADDRLRESIIWLASGYGMFLQFIQSLNILSKTKFDKLIANSSALVTLANAQNDLQQSNNPVSMFFEALDELVSTAQCQIVPVGHAGEIEKKNGVHIGYEDNNYIYLIPNMTHQEVYNFYKKQDVHFPLSKEQLYKNLMNDGLVVPGLDGKTSKQKSIPNRTTKRYLWLVKSKIPS